MFIGKSIFYFLLLGSDMLGDKKGLKVLMQINSLDSNG